MFNRTAPRALALAFAIVIVFVLAIVAVTAVPVATAPAGASHIVPCAEFADGNPTDATGGVCYLPEQVNGHPTLDTADWGTGIPRCASDDWNNTRLPRCYTESPTDVQIVGADDVTLATLSK